VKVDVWSDIACPWCYIGKRRLEAGIAAYAGGGSDRPPVQVEYHSFQLSPDTPVGFEGSVVDYLVRQKRFSEAQVRAMLDRVTAIAREEGLHFDFGTVRHTNTVKAHELLHYAKALGRQMEMKERLLRAYFSEGELVSDLATLARLAADVGLDEDEVREELATGRYADDVREDERTATSLGITAVPFFVVDGKFGVAGAQPPELLLQLLQEARKRAQPISVVADGAACGPDGC
jgi:predicted DsbA family dithiol-disulfide isomerase